MGRENALVPTIRLLLADGEPIRVEGLRARLQDVEGIDVLYVQCRVGEVGAHIQALAPDIAALDLSRDVGGLQAVSELHETLPATLLMLFAPVFSAHDVHDAFRAGAMALILHDDPLRDFPGIIRQVKSGRQYVSPDLMPLVAQALAAPPARGTRLSNRELEILRYVGAGLTARAIGLRLDISPRTVETHRNHIMRKLGANKVNDLVRIAVERGLVPKTGTKSPAE
jgi:DNA-binding NarL/FixJ family response regulator